jgi:hypothetical protein
MILMFFLETNTHVIFIKQFRICWNDITITENLDFVFETNILGATISDSVKQRKPETFTPVGDIDASVRSVCGRYINMRAINPGSPLVEKYNINIPMTTFNIFDKIRYLPTFFGNWTLEIVPTIDNMIMKVIENNNIDTNTHINKEMAYQYYGVGTPCYYPVAAVADPSATWIMLTPQSYKITRANFYTSQFKLIPDRYILLVSQFSQHPLQLLFVKVISTPCGETFTGPAAGVPGPIISVTKQSASQIDSLFITFHTDRRAKAICIQPFIENFKITVEETGNNTYPGGGITMNTWIDHIQYQML